MEPEVSAVANGPNVALLLSFGVPVFAVLVWFLHRVFSGSWVMDPAPSSEPPPGTPPLEPKGERP